MNRFNEPAPATGQHFRARRALFRPAMKFGVLAAAYILAPTPESWWSSGPCW